MATLASSTPHLLLHRLILRRSVPFLTSALSLSSQPKRSFPSVSTTPFTTHSQFSTRSSLFSSLAPTFSLPQQLENDVGLLEDVEIESESEDNAVSADAAVVVAASSEGSKKSILGLVRQTPTPSLSMKEKKELSSYAHSLGKKLKSQQVGKSGVTDTVVMALIETLEANELLKLKIHNSCPGEMEEVVKHLEESTGSLVVGQIGRTVILYRPSMTKLKAEEKKKQNQLLLLKRQSRPRPPFQGKRPVSMAGQETRQYGRGRRGTSRY
ncbi:hypothetical protein ABFS82_02G018700 [Erythranthe guttata]|uniref:CRM domain-containing protein n=1 Tax=Erythranthe guttata TaxID=4155 RepID=A0A022RC68_ERYGU|nr:PREDICTED: uncharacterized protein LOC105957691 [Erythranthe guttata]EYU37846.1 hypothetical protein MIMGU_mgv1a011902mg [Erythranthe guttata]|eukprot:XP_012837103.1 PREDICTED: uncharacterized protein LOC105957691 [Erythranthe guttata]